MIACKLNFFSHSSLLNFVDYNILPMTYVPICAPLQNHPTYVSNACVSHCKMVTFSFVFIFMESVVLVMPFLISYYFIPNLERIAQFNNF
jgi:hypothetical protein